jgi:hypothetical protein
VVAVLESADWFASWLSLWCGCVALSSLFCRFGLASGERDRFEEAEFRILLSCNVYVRVQNSKKCSNLSMSSQAPPIGTLHSRGVRAFSIYVWEIQRNDDGNDVIQVRKVINLDTICLLTAICIANAIHVGHISGRYTYVTHFARAPVYFIQVGPVFSGMRRSTGLYPQTQNQDSTPNSAYCTTW